MPNVESVQKTESTSAMLSVAKTQQACIGDYLVDLPNLRGVNDPSVVVQQRTPENPVGEREVSQAGPQATSDLGAAKNKNRFVSFFRQIKSKIYRPLFDAVNIARIEKVLSKEKTQQAIWEFIGLSSEEKKSSERQEKLLENFPQGTKLAGAGGLGFVLIYKGIAFKIQRNNSGFQDVAQKEYQAPQKVVDNLTKMNKKQSFFKNAENSIIRTI